MQYHHVTVVCFYSKNLRLRIESYHRTILNNQTICLSVICLLFEQSQV
ncbi:hypothetical protein VA7868_02885 [Vibrio aerogenes CECT 7868]|uniref:Uncharacterized protein n=1 Tax=Vibrio aerogenes CECT 7868 TaxID=1216006 RepID=A0A1M5ZLC2_9VIBR|nr:hypothetical protein VA7868_02885 [Vibrio aerogenes CECT 7868]